MQRTLLVVSRDCVGCSKSDIVCGAEYTQPVEARSEKALDMCNLHLMVNELYQRKTFMCNFF